MTTSKDKGFLEDVDAQAEEFISLFFEGDNRRLAFRCLSNKFAAKRAKLEGTRPGIKHLTGTYDQVKTTLHKANSEVGEYGGDNVYFYINEIDFAARKKRIASDKAQGIKVGSGVKEVDVVGVNAVYLEIDGPVDTETIKQLCLDYSPSLVVQTRPGRFHCYWRVDAEDKKEVAEDYGDIQTQLAYKFRELGTDAGAPKKIAALRLPGYKNWNNEQGRAEDGFTVKTGWIDADAVYSYKALEDLFSLSTSQLEEARAYFKKKDGNFDEINVEDGYLGVKEGEGAGRDKALFLYMLKYFLSYSVPYEHGLTIAKTENKKNEPPLEDVEVTKVVKSAYSRAVQADKSGHLSLNKSAKKIASGFKDEVDPDLLPPATASIRSQPKASKSTKEEAHDFIYKVDGPEFLVPTSEDALVQRMVQRYEQDFKFFKHKKKEVWYAYDGFIWRSHNNDAHILLANAVNYVIYGMLGEEFVKTYFARKLTGTKGQLPSQSEVDTAVSECVASAATSQKRSQVLRSLQTRSEFTCKESDFESIKEGELIAVRNGLLNLRLGEFVESSKSIMLTTQLSVKYNKDAKCPKWEKYVADSLEDDPEAIEYLQRVCGYTLTGLNHEQSLFIVYGLQGSGKSTFLNILIKILQEYHMELPKDLFVKSRYGSSSKGESSLAQSIYSRMATVEEVEESEVWNASFVKSVTGNDKVSIKDLYESSDGFTPTMKIFVRANELPKSSSVDPALWIRLKFLPFMKTFRGTEEEIKGLDEMLISEELEGIFAWMVRGAMKYLEDKDLKVSSRASDLAVRIQNENDNFILFMIQCLKRTEDFDDMLGFSDLNEEYLEWCEEEGHKPQTQTKIKQILELKRVELVRKRDGDRTQKRRYSVKMIG